jgi:hypothetical protein
LFYFSFFLFLGGTDYYFVPYNTVVTGILNIQSGKHDMHFLIGVELLPHAFVNIPDEKMHIGVFIFIIFLITIIFIVYFCMLCIFIHSSLPMMK